MSVVGIDTPNFVVDSFDVSYGDPQTVAVTAKRDLAGLLMNYRINGGRTASASAREWDGGERYGFENNDYYAEYRGEVRGAAAGDEVEVWFTGDLDATTGRAAAAGRERPLHVHGRRATPGSPVLIIANEDYTGVNPDVPGRRPAPKYVDEHVAALAGQRRSRPTSGTSTPRACPTTSACSATTPPCSGTSATTG